MMIARRQLDKDLEFLLLLQCLVENRRKRWLVSSFSLLRRQVKVDLLVSLILGNYRNSCSCAATCVNIAAI